MYKKYNFYFHFINSLSSLTTFTSSVSVGGEPLLCDRGPNWLLKAFSPPSVMRLVKNYFDPSESRL